MYIGKTNCEIQFYLGEVKKAEKGPFVDLDERFEKKWSVSIFRRCKYVCF